jgi:hypothetical protein
MNRRRKTTIGGQFAPRLIEMLESSAYRALSLSGHRVLARLEIELGHHGGTDNGRLPVTYADFERYGIERKSIAPALREVLALGFVRITERGRPSKSDFGRHPNYFEITYLRGAHGEEPTHEWKRHKTLQEAVKVAQQARLNKDAKAVAIQMAGLELGMFTERKEIKHLSSEFEKMSDLEIVQMLEAEARRLLLEDQSSGDGGKDGKDRS